MDLQSLKFWDRAKIQVLTADMQNVLKDQFKIETNNTSSWQMITKSAKYNGQKVKRVRIFDTAKLNGKHISNYDDLIKDQSMFEGRIEKSGAIVIYDNRRRSAREAPNNTVRH